MKTQTQNSPEKADLLEHQAVVADTQAAVQRLEKAIAEQEALMATAKKKEPDLEPLKLERNAVLAAITLGMKTPGDLAVVDGSISKAEASRLTIGPTIKRAQETIEGLNRMLQRTQGMLLSLQDKTGNLLRQFLMSEAEAEGAEYAALAVELVESYKRVSSLGYLLLQKGQVPSIQPMGTDMSIPCFGLESNKPYADFTRPSAIFEPARSFGVVMRWADEEVSRLRASGIEID